MPSLSRRCDNRNHKVRTYRVAIAKRLFINHTPPVGQWAVAPAGRESLPRVGHEPRNLESQARLSAHLGDICGWNGRFVIRHGFRPVLQVGRLT